MKNNTLYRQVQELHGQGHKTRETSQTLKIKNHKAEHLAKKLDQLDQLGRTMEQIAPQTPANDLSDMAQIMPEPLYHPALGVEKGKKDTKINSEPHTLPDLRQTMLQIQLYKQAYNEFVAEMVIIHKRNGNYTVQSYQQHQQKAQRLIEAGRLLALQLQAPFESLLISQVLGSILNTINKILSGEDEVTKCCNTLYLGNRCRSLGFWQHSIHKDFFQPKF